MRSAGSTMEHHTQRTDRLVGYRFHMFVASPMSGFSDPLDFVEHRGQVCDSVELIKRCCGLTTVYSALDTVADSGDFDQPGDSLEADVDALRNSAMFCLFYPSPAASSSLVEAGFALALQKPTIIFARRRGDLPYLLREADNLSGINGFPHVGIHEYKDLTNVVERACEEDPWLRRLTSDEVQ